MAQRASSVPSDPSPFHSGPWLSRHDRLNSKHEKVRTFYEGVEGVECGLLRQKDTRMAGQILPPCAGVGVTAIVWGLRTMGWGRLVCMSVYVGLRSNIPNAIQSLRSSAGVTFQEISTDVGLGPQLSSRSSREGLGGVKWVAERERERSVGCCLSHLARSRSFMAYGGEHW